MTSSININNPTNRNPSIKSIRDNFVATATDINTILNSIPFNNSVIVNEISEFQEKHDYLVSIGGGTLHFIPYKIYGWSSSDNNKVVDTSFVSIEFNRSQHDLTLLGDGGIGFEFINSVPGVSLPYRNREYNNGYIYTNITNIHLSSSGPTGIYFNSDVINTSNRITLNNMKIARLFKGATYKSRSYFVCFKDSSFEYNRHGVYTEQNPEDWAERNVFDNVTFGDNGCHVSSINGQIFRFCKCSFDYHKINMFDLRAGTKFLADSCHFEWSYGQNSDQTNSPVIMKGSNTSFIVTGNNNFIYVGTGQNPYYKTFIDSDDITQKIIIDSWIFQKMGRLNNNTDIDALVNCSAGGVPLVKLNLLSNGVDPNDIPTNTVISESLGQLGLLRSGIEDPYAELINKISTTGSVVVSRVSGDENGVTRLNSRPMIKISGVGTAKITLPLFEPNRRHMWSFLYNSSFVTGNVIIKERLTGFSSKFDGTNITWVPDNRGGLYNSKTFIINNDTNIWKRCSWKDCVTGQNVNGRQNMASSVNIEIDTSNLSNGALYLSYFGFDLS